MAQQPPKLIAGRYEIIAEIGRGGMGLVARAYDHRLDTEVAVKVLRDDLAKDSGDKDSLIKEARVLARLTHPSIVRLFDLAETEVGLMLVLEYVRGPNLAHVMESRGRLTIPEYLHVMRQVCAGLAAAHAEGVIHRDLKPPNLLVAPRMPQASGAEFLLNSAIKITDFGISKLLASKAQATAVVAATSAAGTPIFMAPEQFAGRPCTPATDIYALGVITYLALSGRPPFVSDNVRELAFQHFQATAKPIPECSPEVNSVILRALAKVPAERFQSATDFLDAIEDACQPAPSLRTAEPPILEPDGLDHAAAWLGRHWWKLALGSVAILAGVITLVIQQNPQPPLGRTPAAFQPSLGRIVRLPTDLDVVPTAALLPPAIVAEPQTAHPGPRTAPHGLWSALLDTDDFHAGALIDGVSAEGTVYIRDEGSKSLWAVNDSGLKWGYRAPEPPDLLKLGVHLTSWPNGSHIDFRDPGRVWLAACSSDCFGVVFNPAGAGGIYNQVPVALRSPEPPAEAVSSRFQVVDPQNGHWPVEHPRLRYNSRLGVVSLVSVDRGWSIPLDSRPTQAVETAGKLQVLTFSSKIYAIDASGKVEWTYQTPEIQMLRPLPSGVLLLLAGKSHQTLEAVRSGNKLWDFGTRGWIRDIGPVDATGALYLVSDAGNQLAFYGIDREGKPMWSMLWSGLTSSSERLWLDAAGRLYLSGGRFEVDNKARKGVVCLVE